MSPMRGFASTRRMTACSTCCSTAPGSGRSSPRGTAAKSFGDWLVPWPKLLQPFLKGRTQVTVRPHGSTDALYDDEVSFGGASQRIRVVDKQGNALAIDKGGRLQRNFDDTDDSTRDDHRPGRREGAPRPARGVAGVDAYLSYGCLLGAVRDRPDDRPRLGRRRRPTSASTPPVRHHPRVRDRRQDDARPRLEASCRCPAPNFKIWVPAARRPACGHRRVRRLLRRRHASPHARVADGELAARRAGAHRRRSSSRAGRSPPRPRPRRCSPSSTATAGGCRTRRSSSAARPGLTYGAWTAAGRGTRGGAASLERVLQVGRGRARVPTEPSPFARVGRASASSRATSFGSTSAAATAGTRCGWPSQGFQVVGAGLLSERSGRGPHPGPQDAGRHDRAAGQPRGPGPRCSAAAARFAHARASRATSTPASCSTRCRVEHGRADFWRFASMVQRRGGRTFLEFRMHRSRNERTAFEQASPSLPQAQPRGRGDRGGRRPDRGAGRGTGTGPVREREPPCVQTRR